MKNAAEENFPKKPMEIPLTDFSESTSEEFQLFKAIREVGELQNSEVDEHIAKILNLVSKDPKLLCSSSKPNQGEGSPLFCLLYQMKQGSKSLSGDSKKNLEQLAVQLVKNDNVNFAQQTQNGDTVLHYAFFNGFYKVAKTAAKKLAEKGDISVCMEVQNSREETPFINILNSNKLINEQKWELLCILQPYISFLQFIKHKENMTTLIKEKCREYTIFWLLEKCSFAKFENLIGKIQNYVNANKATQVNNFQEECQCLENLLTKLQMLTCNNLKETTKWVFDQMDKFQPKEKTSIISKLFSSNPSDTVEKCLRESKETLLELERNLNIGIFHSYVPVLHARQLQELKF